MDIDAPERRLELPPLAFLGAGSMGGALVAGIVGDGPAVTGGITVTNRTLATARSLAHLPGVRSLALEDDAGANRAAVAGAGIVVIGVKPAVAVELLEEIASSLRPEAVLVSVAAGCRLP